MKLFIEFVAVFIMVLSFGVIFHTPRKSLWLIGLTGVISWAGFLISHKMINNVVIPSFIAASLVGISGEIFARLGKLPVTVFVIPGIIPLVPGAYAYDTMLNMLKGQYIDGIKTGIDTLMIAGAIAFAIAIVGAIAKSYKEWKYKKKNFKNLAPLRKFR